MHKRRRLRVTGWPGYKPGGAADVNVFRHAAESPSCSLKQGGLFQGQQTLLGDSWLAHTGTAGQQPCWRPDLLPPTCFSVLCRLFRRSTDVRRCCVCSTAPYRCKSMMGSGSALSHSFNSPATCTQQEKFAGVSGQTLPWRGRDIALNRVQAEIRAQRHSYAVVGADQRLHRCWSPLQPIAQEAHCRGVLDADASNQGVPTNLKSLAQHVGLPVRGVRGKEAGFCKRLLVLEFDQVGEGVSEHWNVSATLTAVLQH